MTSREILFTLGAVALGGCATDRVSRTVADDTSNDSMSLTLPGSPNGSGPDAVPSAFGVPAREGQETATKAPPVATKGPVGSDPSSPATYVETITGTGATFTMVWVPEGRFWIGQTEVTWNEYLSYCTFDGPAHPPGVDAVARPSKPLETFPFDREWGMGKRPAVGMSWNASKKYCQWLSSNTGRAYELPRESEWMLACGPASTDLDKVAWYDDNSDDQTQEVGAKSPNRHGLHDMLGNLWEYCAEPFDVDQPEWALLKGGSWADPDDDATPAARLQFDEFWNLEDPNVPPGVWWVPEGDHVGFRVLRRMPAPTDQGDDHDEDANR